jgi:hypothetical protein
VEISRVVIVKISPVGGVKVLLLIKREAQLSERMILDEGVSLAFEILRG